MSAIARLHREAVTKHRANRFQCLPTERFQWGGSGSGALWSTLELLHSHSQHQPVNVRALPPPAHAPYTAMLRSIHQSWCSELVWGWFGADGQKSDRSCTNRTRLPTTSCLSAFTGSLNDGARLWQVRGGSDCGQRRQGRGERTQNGVWTSLEACGGEPCSFARF